MEKNYFIGIDGGGSKTSYILMDAQGNVVQSFKNGSTTFDTVSREDFISRVQEGLEKITKCAGHIVSLFGGFAGTCCEEDYDEIITIIKNTKTLPNDTFINIGNDIYNAFYSTFTKSGMVLIVGTGSVAFGKDTEGHEVRLGGYGHLEGDKGSGYFIGISALRILAKMYDNVYPFNDVFKGLSDLIKVHSKSDLIKYIMTSTKTIVASSTRYLIEHSDDTYIHNILVEGAQEYVLLVHSIGLQLPKINRELTIIGSAGLNTTYLSIILEEINKLDADIKFINHKYEADLGAAKYSQLLYEDIKTIKLIPYYSYRVWGGNKFIKDPHCTLKDHIGEAWILSTRAEASSTLNGEYYMGKPLSAFYEAYPSYFFKEITTHFPLLIKLIDASDDLSIQVHPGEEVCKELHGESKNECWYILDTQNHNLLCGVNTKNKNDIIKALNEGHILDVVSNMNIDNDDFIFIGEGTIHAIKKGTFLLEVQENSDTTYRLYDYHRLDHGKERTLHIEEGKKSINPESDYYIHKKTSCGEIVSNKYFKIDKVMIDHETTLPIENEMQFIYCLKGSVTVNGKEVKQGESILITTLAERVIIKGVGVIIKVTK